MQARKHCDVIFPKPAEVESWPNSGSRHGAAPRSPRPTNTAKKTSASSVSSSSTEPWSVYSSSQNLVSILNNPSKPRSAIESFFTKDWGTAFVDTPSTSLSLGSSYSTRRLAKSISKQEFESYMRKVHKRRNVLNQVHKIEEEKKEVAIRNKIDCQTERKIHRIPSVFFDPNFDVNNETTFKELFLSALPSFSAAEGSKRTNDSIDSTGSMKKELKLMERKFSDYLDCVEEELARQVSNKSKDFFHVMTSMDIVMHGISNTIRSVSNGRSKCNLLQRTLIEPSLQSIYLHARRRNALEVLEKLNLMSTVHQTQPSIQLSLSSSDFVAALDLISTSREVVDQDLALISSFRHLNMQLDEIENVIGRMMLEDFAKLLAAHWNRPIICSKDNDLNGDCVANKDIDQDGKEVKLRSIVLGLLRAEEVARQRLAASSVKQKELQSSSSPSHEESSTLTCEVWMKVMVLEAKTAVKAIIKQTIFEFTSKVNEAELEIGSPCNEDQNTIRAQSQMNDLSIEMVKHINDFDQWISLIQMILKSLLILLRRIETLHRVISHAINSNFDNNVSDSENSLPIFRGQTSDLIDTQCNLKVCDTRSSKLLATSFYEICEFIQNEVATILEARLDMERLTSDKFLIFFQVVDRFGEEIKNTSESFTTYNNSYQPSQRSPLLKLLLSREGNRFVSRFHEERKKRLHASLEIETWKSLNESQLNGNQLFMHVLRRIENESGIEFKPIIITSSVLSLVDIVLEYAKCSERMLFLAPDFSTRCLNLLKSFNTRTNKLVLGAQAVQVAGLKTITTRNLIVCRRILLFVAAFINSSFVRKHFELLMELKESAHMSDSGNNLKNREDSPPLKNQNHENGAFTTTHSNNASPSNENSEEKNLQRLMTARMKRHFDELIIEYHEHADRIPDKVVSIVKDLIVVQISKWEARPPVPSPHFQAIADHLFRLYDNVKDALPKSDLKHLFHDRIHGMFKEVLREHLSRLGISADGGPQHGLVTQELTFYCINLNSKTELNMEIDKHFSDLWTFSTDHEGTSQS